MAVVEVSCAVLERDGCVLIARRASHKAMAGFWEFPGGKIEAGETPEQSLARELVEELGIEVAVGEYLATSEEQSVERLLRLHCYRVRWLGGEIRLIDHDRYLWVEKSALASYRLCPPDRPLLDYL